MDILAIQQIYGAYFETRDGDTTYGFSVTADVRDEFNFTVNEQPIVTIWDGGGVDTLDFSEDTADQWISLVPGTYSSVLGMVENVGIAYTNEDEGWIESAIGGSGNDVLIGNEHGNELTGGPGDDVLRSGEGGDRLFGGGGSDRLIGGAGHDRLWGDADNDLLVGGAGDDRLEGGAGDDHFLIRGPSGQDTILDFDQGGDGAGDRIVLVRLGPALNAFEALDSNGNDVLDDGDQFVTVTDQDTTIDLAAAVGGIAGVAALTALGVTELTDADLAFV